MKPGHQIAMSGHKIRTMVLIILILTSFLCHSQNADKVKDSAAQDASFFITLAAKQLKWEEPVEPRKIVGPIYFVGTKGLSSFLITSPAGPILLYTGMPSSGPMIEASIRKLGFKPEDIKVLLTGHAHVDHVGGHAYIKKISGAQVAVMEAEKELIESGGKSDFQYASYSGFWFEPVKVDRLLHNKDSVMVGTNTLFALHTPGHTRGTTTWTMNVEEGGKRYVVVFSDGTSINPGYRLVVNPSYPGIQKDFESAMNTLGALYPDIWLSPHTDFFNFNPKLARADSIGAAAFVDPDGFRKRIASARAQYDAQVKKETQTKEIQSTRTQIYELSHGSKLAGQVGHERLGFDIQKLQLYLEGRTMLLDVGRDVNSLLPVISLSGTFAAL